MTQIPINIHGKHTANLVLDTHKRFVRIEFLNEFYNFFNEDKLFEVQQAITSKYKPLVIEDDVINYE